MQTCATAMGPRLILYEVQPLISRHPLVRHVAEPGHDSLQGRRNVELASLVPLVSRRPVIA